MHLLALSGSLRATSTNTALLRVIAATAPPSIRVAVFEGLGHLPLFSPDLEGEATPPAVLDFATAVVQADGLIIACPEYVRALPGAFKNALDWLVSRPDLTFKPIALLHASHRGEDVLGDLRRVLGTVSQRFAPEIFARFPLSRLSPDAVAKVMSQPANRAKLLGFLSDFVAHISASEQQ